MLENAWKVEDVWKLCTNYYVMGERLWVRPPGGLKARKYCEERWAFRRA